MFNDYLMIFLSLYDHRSMIVRLLSFIIIVPNWNNNFYCFKFEQWLFLSLFRFGTIIFFLSLFRFETMIFYRSGTMIFLYYYSDSEWWFVLEQWFFIVPEWWFFIVSEQWFYFYHCSFGNKSSFQTDWWFFFIIIVLEW